QVEDIFVPELQAVLCRYGTVTPCSDSGMGWGKILCPVHDERNPSATVNLELGKIHCHACGWSGDALDLVGEKERCGVVEASDFSRENFPEASGGHLPQRSDRLTRTGVSGGPGSHTRRGRGSPSRLRRRTRWD